MPRTTIHKIFLIACFAGIAAAPLSIGHAGKTASIGLAIGAPAYRTAPQMCPAARRTEIRTPVYKRYLNLTPAPLGQTVLARGK